MREHYKLIAVIFFFLLIYPSLSINYNASLKVLKNNVFPGQTAEYEIAVTNMGEKDTFTIYVQSSRPGWFSQKDYLMEIDKGKTEKTIIYATPSKDAVEGNVGFFVYVYPKSNSSQFTKMRAFVKVLRNESLILEGISTNKDVYNPGETVEVKANVKSVVRRFVENYSLIFEFLNESREVLIPKLRGGDSFTGVAEFSIEKNVAGSQDISVSLIDKNGKVLGYLKTRIFVPSIENITIEEDIKDFLLWKDVKIKIRNEGNVRKDEIIVNRDLSLFQSLFFSSKDEIVRKEKIDGKRRYYWKISDIDPGEEVVIEYRINYYIFYLIILFLIAIILISLKEFHSVSIVKKTFKKGKIHTVHIHISNKSSRRANKIEVKDFLPYTCNLLEEFNILKPKVKKKEEFYEIIWNVGSLESGEERVLSYKFVPKIETDEEVELPKAEIKFVMNNRERILRSNKVFVKF